MRKTINKETVSGRVYEHKLVVKQVKNQNSENFGKDFISGTIDVATDEDCLNIVTVHFTYVTPTTKTGSANTTFAALKKIIDSGKTVVADGKDEATMVTINTALDLNDFYTDRDGNETLVSAKRNEGGFVTIVNKLDADETKRNTFEFDFLVNGTRLVEADGENVKEDYLVVKGGIFNFRNAILPVELIVKSAGGIKYFESLEVSPKNLVFTKVWGNINSETIVRTVEEETAFGEPSVKEYSRSIKEWVITKAAKEPYEIGDEENGITTEEIEKALSDREVALAENKKKQDEWKAAQAVTNPTTAPTGATTAAAGGFNF